MYEIQVGKIKAEKDFDKGLMYIEDLKKAHPNIDDVYIAIASLYIENDLSDEALEVLDEGLAVADDKEWLNFLKASYLADQGEIDGATNLFSTVHQEFPNFAPAYTRAAKILADQGEKDNAKVVYEAGLKSLPKNEQILFDYCLLLSDMGDEEGALVNLKKLVGIAPKNSTYLAYLGNTYLNLSFNGLALEAYCKANTIAKENEEWIVSNIGNLYKNRGFYPQAVKFLRQALKLDGSSSYAHERLAIAIKEDEEERKSADEVIRKYRQRKRAEAKAALADSADE